jgi:heterodisulfide reductase subunit A-like polyferredoxin
MTVEGGIAEMQAASDLASSGYYIHLVEEKPASGGVITQLDKTFSTNDSPGESFWIPIKKTSSERSANLAAATICSIGAPVHAIAP